MKTERRHELQRNELADRLGTTLEWVEANYRTVLGVIVALTVVIGAGLYLRSESASRRGQAWDRYFQAQNAQDPLNEMLTVADNYDGTAAASWAKLTVADSQLAIGTDQLFRDRAEANSQLRKAQTNFQEIADSSLANSEPLLKQRALFGLARTCESLGELDRAKATYAELTDKAKWPHPVFGLEAERRIKSLDQPSTKAFYDWFARQEPKVETAPATTPIDEKLPDESEFPSTTPPTDAASAVPATETTEIAVPVTGTPNAEAPAADTTAPAEAAPATPADPAAPAETPAAPPADAPAAPPADAPSTP